MIFLSLVIESDFRNFSFKILLDMKPLVSKMQNNWDFPNNDMMLLQFK